jgi:hypothetical protein
MCAYTDLCVFFSLQETVNPKHELESFDAIHFSALQVIIIATANGVRPNFSSSTIALLIEVDDSGPR